MGAKRPDQISPHQWREGAETVAKMHTRGWELTARCRRCDLVMAVDLRVTIATRGPNFSLWNKHPRCRRVAYVGRCNGVMDLAFKAPGMTLPKPLAAPDRTEG